MGIEIVLLLEELQKRDISNYLVVIINVLRASSTIVTALAENAVRVIPVFSPAEARKRAAKNVADQYLGSTTYSDGI